MCHPYRLRLQRKRSVPMESAVYRRERPKRFVRQQTNQLPVLRLGQTEERNQHIRKCSPTLPIAKPVLRPRDGAELQPIQVLFT